MIRSMGRMGRKRRGRVLFCFVSALFTLMVLAPRAWPQTGGTSGNLLVNGSFEGTTYSGPNGDMVPTGWTLLPTNHVSLSDFNIESTVNALTFQGAEEGTHYAAFRSKETDSSQDCLVQYFDTIPGQQYTVSFWVAITAASVSNTRLLPQWDWKGAGQKDMKNDFYFAPTNTGPVSYRQFTFTETASSSRTGLMFHGTDSNGAILLDNVVVTPSTSTGAPAINQGGIVNLASYVAPVVAGSLAAVFGISLASGQVLDLTTPLPNTLAGSSFQIAGHSGLVPLIFASPTQVNLQIPWELAGSQQASVTATVGANVSAVQNVTLAASAPGIFTLNQQGSGQGAILIANTATLAGTQGSGRAVKKGEYISIFCTGLGAVNNQPPTGTAAKSNPLSHTLTTPTVTIGGAAATVTYSGLAPGFAGLYQVDAQVPSDAPSGGTVAVVMKIGGSTSNTVTIAVQ